MTLAATSGYLRAQEPTPRPQIIETASLEDRADALRTLMLRLDVEMTDTDAMAVISAAARYAEDAFTIPEQAPTPGFEWAHLLTVERNGSVDEMFGAAHWRLVDGGQGLRLEAAVAIPELGFGVTLGIARGSRTDFDAYLITIEVAAPFGELQGIKQFGLTDSFLIDNVPVSVLSSRDGNIVTARLPLSAPIEEGLLVMDGISISLSFSGNLDVSLTAALGETGAGLLREALARWADPPPARDLIERCAGDAPPAEAVACLYVDGSTAPYGAGAVDWAPTEEASALRGTASFGDGTVLDFIALPNGLAVVPSPILLDIVDQSADVAFAFRPYVRLLGSETDDSILLRGDRLLSNADGATYALALPYAVEPVNSPPEEPFWLEVGVTSAGGRSGTLLVQLDETAGRALMGLLGPR